MTREEVISQMRFLTSLYDQDSSFSTNERNQLAQLAAMAGFTPEEAQQYSDGMVPPQFYANFLESGGGLPIEQAPAQAPSDLTITPVGGAPTGGPGTIANSPVNPNPQPPSIFPNPIQTIDFQQPSPVNPPVNTPTLPPLENLGNTFADNFGNNPGALGFSDLNPLVSGADNVTQTAIPEFLKPFLAQGVDSSQGALTSLTQLLARDNALTSPFNSLQEQAQQQALGVASGAGGFLPAAQNTLMEIADSGDIMEIFNKGRSLLENPMGLSGLNDFASGGFGNPTAMNTLESTARGDFLFGSPAFDEAVQASIRATRPNIQSGFALQGGQGAVGSGLAQAAIQEAASDAFARQFGAERDRMLGASGSLNNFDLNSNAQRLGALNSMVGAQQNAGGVLTGMANADRSRQFQAAQLLPQFGLLGSQITGGVGDARQSQEERTKLGQVQAMQNLLNSSFGQINPNSLFGNINSVQTSSNPLLGAIGGALGGNEVGSLFGGAGGMIGAGIGGLLGAFG